MLGLRMFKGSENYSFEMDESCTCQVYQSCTLYISFPLASMHNFPSMQISTQWQRRARLARLPEHVPWHRKWIISTEQGTKQCNFVYGGLRISFIAGRYSQRSLQNTNSRSGWNQSRMRFIKITWAPPQSQSTLNLSGLGVPLASYALSIRLSVQILWSLWWELSLQHGWPIN